MQDSRAAIQRSESFDHGPGDRAQTSMDYHILHGGSLRNPAMNKHYDPYSIAHTRGE